MKTLLLIATIVTIGGCTGMPVSRRSDPQSAARVPVVTSLPKIGERRTAQRLADEELAAQNRTTVQGNLLR